MASVSEVIINAKIALIEVELDILPSVPRVPLTNSDARRHIARLLHKYTLTEISQLTERTREELIAYLE